MERLNVAIADDNERVLELLSDIVNNDKGLTLVGKANNGEEDLKAHNINNAEEFVNFADFFAGGMKDCYAIGFAFHKYFLEVEMV